MLNNKGFTLIESLFVISIISISCLISTYMRPYHINNDNVINDISLFILYAKTGAMVYKESVDIEFDGSHILISSTHLNKTYTVEKGYFSYHKLSYNKQGHIINPKTVSFYLNNIKFKLVFQIGSGAFYVQK